MEEREKYVCKKCGYRFSRAKGREITVCPYCGKDGTVEIDLPNKAERLIKESEIRRR